MRVLCEMRWKERREDALGVREEDEGEDERDAEERKKGCDEDEGSESERRYESESSLIPWV